MKKALSIFLNLSFGLFLACAVVSVVDDSLQLLFRLSVLSLIVGILSFFAVLAALVVYVLMGFLPMVPKRVFLPVVIFYPVGLLAVLPLAIYGGSNWAQHTLQLDWALSFGQLLVGLGILCRLPSPDATLGDRDGAAHRPPVLSGKWKFRWPLFAEKHLRDRRFSWLNLSVFAGVNVFVLLPAMIVYLGLCAALAVSHFTAGALTVHPGGLTAQVRQYVRSDGKKIELVPMAHVADASFYRQISKSFPTNSIVLMEGVRDERNLLTNGISYKRMAHSLGLSEQKDNFKPQGKIIMADVDVDQFATSTIELLNVAMLIHGQGINLETLMKLALYSPPPHVEVQLFEDIVEKRNQHLLETLQIELAKSDDIIVPWGAYHMPELATAIQKDGFHLAGSENYTVVRFGHEEKISVAR